MHTSKAMSKKRYGEQQLHTDTKEHRHHPHIPRKQGTTQCAHNNQHHGDHKDKPSAQLVSNPPNQQLPNEGAL